MANQKVSIEFDVNVDPLSDILSKKAEEELVKKLVGMAETMVFDHKGYGYGAYRQPNNPSSRSGINEPMKEIIVKFMEDNKEEIIARTAENLTRRLANSKACKGMLEEIRV